MTAQEAIDQGYEHWIYANGGFQSIRDLQELLSEDSGFIWMGDIELIEKEPYHPENIIDAKDILGIVGDQLQLHHEDNSGDDTGGVYAAINTIDPKIIQPLLDEIQNKLNGLNYYRSTGISLTK